MASVGFGHRDVLRLAAHVVDFQNVEANAGTDWTDDIAFLRGTQRLSEDGWQFLNTPPAHLAAFQRLLVRGVGDGELAEVGAVTRLLDDRFRLALRFVYLI